MSLTGFLSYSRVNWQQSPSKSTPLSAANLNVMDAGIKNNNDMISNLRDEVTQLNNNFDNVTPYIDYNGEGKLSEAFDIVKDIHSKYDLHEPSVIKIDSNGTKACIGYNYGTNSPYGAYLYFSVFGELMYIRCHNSIWYSNQIVLVQTTDS